MIDWRALEEKWQRAWEEARIFEADPRPGSPKFFITTAYPYPNAPQHIGHGRTYSLADAYARFMRMRGYNTLFPMAFHYTGTPIVAMSMRIASGEREIREEYTKLFKITPEIVETFVDPLKMARYFHEEIKAGMKEMGYSIDWRREFTTIDPQYNRFIEWQFRKLREKGLISVGTHPVGWCPNCENPVGQHDTVGDVEPEIGEFTLIKFELGGEFLPAATMRPETVFGVTNLWLRPDAEYVRAFVDGERWIISAEGARKLRFLNRKVEEVDRFRGRELIGRVVKNPATGQQVPVLPARFVDPNNATGVVMSVPAHAPYDYVALEELRAAPEHFGLGPKEAEVVKGLRPISIIQLEGYSDYPAVDVVKRMGIRDQRDPRLKEATEEIYSREYHRGIMRENTPYPGASIAEARAAVVGDLRARRRVDFMYELLNRPVICRCRTECVVKVFEDQWFINYGLEAWKDRALECLRSMKIVPEVLRSEFEQTIRWLKERACARKRGLGTRLPWDPEWIIESLSDSTIYMCYYLIAKYVNQYGLRAEQLTDEVFDFVLLGKGDPQSIGPKVGIEPSLLEEMRQEFAYFYPLDSRNSGRDLVPNHLTFFIFNHAAIFPREFWPRQIVVNGSVLMEGKKMSKSLGNIIPLREAIRAYGADPLRLSILSTAEILQDADFSPALARSIRSSLERFFSFAQEVIKRGKKAVEGPLASVDRWMLSQLQLRVKNATESFEKLRVREAAQQAFFLLNRDVRWYLRRTAGTPEREPVVSWVLNKVLEVQVRLLAPFAPHLCEELWSMMGRKPFVSTAPWPEYDEGQVDLRALEEEDLIRRTFEDTISILKAVRIRPKRVCYYVAADSKWKPYLRALEMAAEGRVRSRELEAEAGVVARICKQISELSQEAKVRRLKVGKIEELRILNEAKTFLERELRAEVLIFKEDDPQRYDPRSRAGLALPYRPAIYIE